MQKCELPTTSKQAKKVAVKIIDRTIISHLRDEEYKKEGLILKQLRHRNIIQIHDFVEQKNCYYMFLEHKDRDFLAFMTERGFLTEKEARIFFRQMFEALDEIHKKHRLCHRDIKLENFLLDDASNTISLIDFGLSSFVSDGNPLFTDFCGSNGYTAPEVQRKICYDGYKADVFSLGTVLYCMVFGCFPFDDNAFGEKQNNNNNTNSTTTTTSNNNPDQLSTTPKLAFPVKYRLKNRKKEMIKTSKELCGLLSGMLEFDPHLRLAMSQIRKHPWIQHPTLKNRLTMIFSVSEKKNPLLDPTKQSNQIAPPKHLA